MNRLFTCMLVMMVAMAVWAENWQQWRGPDANGVAESGDGPVDFSATKGLLWKAKLPGKGASTPIVWKGRIVLTSGVGKGADGEDGVLCFDWKGKMLWQVKLGKQRKGKHRRASGSNPSPVTDGKRIFVYFKTGTLGALDFDGKILWKTNLQERYGKDELWWDLGTSPVLAGENVVVAVMHEKNSYVVAFNKVTGEVAWKVDRNYKCSKETSQSYTTPLVVTDGGSDEIVIWGADHLTGHDAATGSPIWDCGGFNPSNKPLWRVIASPAISQGVAVVPYGRAKYVAGIRIGGNGDITDKARLWQREGMGTDSASPVVGEGKAYIVNFKGDVWCLDVLTGKTLWKTDLPKGKGVFYSSPLLAGDKLYLCRDNGTVYVCQVAGAGLNVLNTVQFEDNFAASPVLVDGKLLLRGEKNLYCFEN